jgi:hypothetical protein
VAAEPSSSRCPREAKGFIYFSELNDADDVDLVATFVAGSNLD